MAAQGDTYPFPMIKPAQLATLLANYNFQYSLADQKEEKPNPQYFRRAFF